jgi:hypothetical protein
MDLESTGRAESTAPAESTGQPALQVAAALSFGAGFVHSAVIGQHTEHRQLALLFLAGAVFQIGWAIVAIARPSRLVAIVGLVGNLLAAGFWLTTRLTSVGWIDGLDHKESVGFADAVTAGLGLAAAIAAGVALVTSAGRQWALPLLPMAAVVALVSVTAAAAGSWSPHSHADGHSEVETAAGHAHGADDPDVEPATRSEALAAAQEAGWPWAWDPAEPIDFASIPGVSREQAEFASRLVEATQRELPRYADFRTAEAAGYVSIRDGGTGAEHFVKPALIDDGKNLDPAAPETIMYNVDPDTGVRTLSGAMFIAEQPEYAIGTEALDAILGPLASWHVHTNVCFEATEGGARVAGLVDPELPCPEGQFKASDDLPMVHVWVLPHQCGPFAALEGIGAGQAGESDAERIDRCRSSESDHGH